MPNTWKPMEQWVVPQPIATTDTTQNMPLGTRVRARNVTNGDVGEFVYAQGIGSTVVGSWALLSADDWSTSLSTTNDVGPHGIAMSANVASQYGWYQIYGKASGKALTGFADDAAVYLTGTAGSIDDADAAGEYVRGAKGASAVNETTLLADFELAYPNTHNALDD